MSPLSAFALAFIVAVGPVALSIMKIVGVVKNRFPSLPHDLWLGLAVVLGIGYAFLTHTDLTHIPNAPAAFAGVTGNWGYLLTGVGVGAVAAYWYEKNTATKAAQKP